MWWYDGREDWKEVCAQPDVAPENIVKVDQQLVDECDASIEFVRERQRLTGAKMYIEQRVRIDHITGEGNHWAMPDDLGVSVPEGTTGAVWVPPATGSIDVALVYGTTVEVIDHKLGRGPKSAYEVVVPAHEDIITGQHVPERVEPNTQLAMYGDGTVLELAMFHEITDVVLVISQPPLNRVSQWSGSVAELRVTIERLRKRAVECDTNPVFRPSPSNCCFCKASGDCKAQTEAVIKTALIGFEDVDTAAPAPIKENALGSLYAALPMIADWCKAVEARVYSDLQQNIPVVRNDGLAYKLVDGKKSARQWADAEEAEAKLIAMRIPRDAIYEKVFISPTTAEKLAAVKKPKKGQPAPPPPVIGPTQWARIQTLITQGQGKPAVALQTDPRPAIAQAATGFEDVPDAVDNSDLF